MKNLQTFESFINEAKDAEKDKKKIIKQINDLIKKRHDREEAIDIVLLDGGYFPETDDNYFDFVQSINSDILDEGRVNEAKETPWDKLNRIADEEYAEFGFQTLDTGDMEDLIDMKKANKIASKEYGEFGFTSLDTEDMEDLINRNPKLIKKQYLNEAFNHVLKPYQLRDAGIDRASLPARGDSKFCVVRHDSIIVNGIEVYLNNAIPGAGQGGVTVSIIGLYDTEEEARAAFKNEVKRRTNGAQLSVSMGNLFNRKFGLQFQEIEGHVAKGTVK